MQSRWAVRVGLVAALGASGCNPADPPAAVTAPRSVTLTPPSASVNVGSALQLTATVSGFQSQVTWTASNASATTVSATGLVTCVAAGTSTIIVTAVADPSIAAASVVTCNAVSLITVSPTTLNFTHVVGASPCPQSVGNVRVTNVAGESVTVTVSGHSALIVETGTTSFAIAAGAFRDIAISFNCLTQTSFTATLVVTATGGGGDAKDVAVNGTIVR